MKKIRNKAGIILSMLTVVALTACSSKTEDTLSSNSDANAETVVVGTGNAYEPYCYLDENGNLAGYEYEVLKAVDELLPQYQFEYVTSDFANVLISLDAGKIDIGAHQYELNEERQEKYLFSKESYTSYITYVTVAAGNSDINSLDDLQGKKVKTSTGSNSTYLLEKYNEEHKDNPIILDYVDNGTDEETITGLQNGIWDAIIVTKRDADKLNKTYGNGTDVIKQVGEPVATSYTYYAYKKDNTKLQEAIDGALKELKESGKLSQISIDIIGGDYTESE
jgi:L-cystine transport system substrate-binding protein